MRVLSPSNLIYIYIYAPRPFSMPPQANTTTSYNAEQYKSSQSIFTRSNKNKTMAKWCAKKALLFIRL